MKKIVGWVAAVVVLVAAGFFAWRWQKSHAAPDITYKTAPIEKRRIVARVTASGTLQATVTVQVGAQVSGRIQKLYADYNSTVKKNELIAKLDPQLFQAAVEQASANHASAKAAVVRAEAQQRDAEVVYQRTKALADQGLASTGELQTAETNVAVTKAATEVAKASLAQSAAALHQAQVNLSYTDIHSPIDGTVISRNVDVGQTVAASLQAPVLFTIAEDLRKMQVHTSVAEGDVGRLEQGMDATFTVDAFPGQRFKGKVGQIRNAAQTVQNVVTYDAVIDVDNSDLRLRPGMTATVTIVWAEKDDVVAVPNTAMRFKPPPEIASAVAGGPSGGPSAGAPGARRPRNAPGDAKRPSETEARTVYVLRNGRPETVRVTPGLTDGTVTEVAEGDVRPGDEAITDVVVAGKAASGAPSGQQRFGRMF
jgi:HlyD family secretion protein